MVPATSRNTARLHHGLYVLGLLHMHVQQVHPSKCCSTGL